MERFLTATDELLFGDTPAQGKLVPYRAGMPCGHWEAIIEGELDGEVIAELTSERYAVSEEPWIPRHERPVKGLFEAVA